MEQGLIFWTIVGMGVVTYLPRLLPTLFLSGRNLHPLIIAWLRLVPPAVLAAMLMPSLLVRESGRIEPGFDNLFLWAALITFSVAWKWQSLFATVLVGMALVALGRALGWGY
ncbi:MAG: AzlD domain-containing protein [Desulforhopalus sp.]|jgi:branched-subunit amino acid transport protein|nr:AzlD domain-containing protein [Desulforhopalus sp.]